MMAAAASVPSRRRAAGNAGRLSLGRRGRGWCASDVGVARRAAAADVAAGVGGRLGAGARVRPRAASGSTVAVRVPACTAGPCAVRIGAPARFGAGREDSCVTPRLARCAAGVAPGMASRQPTSMWSGSSIRSAFAAAIRGQRPAAPRCSRASPLRVSPRSTVHPHAAWRRARRPGSGSRGAGVSEPVVGSLQQVGVRRDQVAPAAAVAQHPLADRPQVVARLDHVGGGRLGRRVAASATGPRRRRFGPSGSCGTDSTATGCGLGGAAAGASARTASTRPALSCCSQPSSGIRQRRLLMQSHHLDHDGRGERRPGQPADDGQHRRAAPSRRRAGRARPAAGGMRPHRTRATGAANSTSAECRRVPPRPRSQRITAGPGSGRRRPSRLARTSMLPGQPGTRTSASGTPQVTVAPHGRGPAGRGGERGGVHVDRPAIAAQATDRGLGRGQVAGGAFGLARASAPARRRGRRPPQPARRHRAPARSAHRRRPGRTAARAPARSSRTPARPIHAAVMAPSPARRAAPRAR